MIDWLLTHPLSTRVPDFWPAQTSQRPSALRPKPRGVAGVPSMCWSRVSLPSWAIE